MKPIDVNLTRDEMLEGIRVGVFRQLENILVGRREAKGARPENDWQVHIEGAMGERAVSKYTGLPWDGSLGKLKNSDVNIYEVRTTSRHSNRLIIHPGDKDNSPFILVTGLNGKYKIHGWLLGIEGKKKRILGRSYWNWKTGIFCTSTCPEAN